MKLFLPALHVLGYALLALAGLLTIPLSLSFLGQHDGIDVFLVTMAASLGTALVLLWGCRKQDRQDALQPRQMFLITVLVWLVVPLYACLPFLLMDNGLTLTDAVFETVSGMTTTGSTVMTELDHLKCYALPIGPDNEVDWRHVRDLDERLPLRVEQLLRDSDAAIALPSLKIGRWLLTSVTDGASARWLIAVDMSRASETNTVVDSVSLLVQQTRLAVERLRLATDVTRERVEKERELLRSALLSSISHDFRTPLTSMVGAATTLEELSDELSAEDRKELLESIVVEARRLDRYTSNLLDMTLLGRGDLTLDRVWTSIDEVLNVVRKRIEPERGDVNVVFEVPDRLPQIRLHPALIEHALFNVLHNALKFSGPDDTVRLTVSVEPDAIIIDVSDCGPGIPLQEREKVFDMFYTAGSGDRRQAGSGLGLAICKGMIGAHGGHVSIDESECGGCLVKIALPLHSDDADEVPGHREGAI